MNEWVQLQSQPKGSITAGGLCRVYGVPVEWVQDIPRENPVSQTITDDIALAAGKDWIPFVWAHSSRVFSEDGKIQGGQPYWESKLTGTLYWNPANQHIQGNNMLFHRWVFLVKESGTTNWYLIGTARKGASMTINYQSRPGTKTEVTAMFRAANRAPIYEGSITGDIIDPGGIFSPVFSLEFA